MESLDDVDVEIGVYGLRTFQQGQHGVLRSITHNYEWSRPNAVAECRQYTAKHRDVPNQFCQCGIYSVKVLNELRRRWKWTEGSPLAVIALSGVVLEGPKGYRAERAQIVALYSSLAYVRDKYKEMGVETYRNYYQMIQGYGGIQVSYYPQESDISDK